MAQVKVYNDNKYVFKDEFKGKTYIIPPGGFIEMEFYDAHEFKAKYYPITRNGDNQPTPETRKMIRIDAGMNAAPAIQDTAFNCVACAFKGTDAKELEYHSKNKHAEQRLVDEMAEKEISVKKKAG
jgi:hypothetical protein